jgi:hypothetical protein
VGVPARAFLSCFLTMIICYTVFNNVCLQPFFDNTHNAHQRIGLAGKSWKENILKMIEKE